MVCSSRRKSCRTEIPFGYRDPIECNRNLRLDASTSVKCSVKWYKGVRGRRERSA